MDGAEPRRLAVARPEVLHVAQSPCVLAYGRLGAVAAARAALARARDAISGDAGALSRVVPGLERELHRALDGLYTGVADLRSTLDLSLGGWVDVADAGLDVAVGRLRSWVQQVVLLAAGDDAALAARVRNAAATFVGVAAHANPLVVLLDIVAGRLGADTEDPARAALLERLRAVFAPFQSAMERLVDGFAVCARPAEGSYDCMWRPEFVEDALAGFDAFAQQFLAYVVSPGGETLRDKIRRMTGDLDSSLVARAESLLSAEVARLRDPNPDSPGVAGRSVPAAASTSASPPGRPPRAGWTSPTPPPPGRCRSRRTSPALGSRPVPPP